MPEELEVPSECIPGLDFAKIYTGEGAMMLVTFDDWFIAPDGNNYKAAWGRTRIVPGKVALGVEPKNTANWFVVIGEGERAIVVAGCRVHYAAICVERPKGGGAIGHVWHNT